MVSEADVRDLLIDRGGITMAVVQNPQVKALERLVVRLQKAVAVGKVTAIRYEAEAIRLYVKSRRSGVGIENDAAEIRLRAERKGGAIVAAAALRGGDRRSVSRGQRSTLSDLGMDCNQSTRWQRVAAISEAVFENYLATARQSGAAISRGALLRFDASTSAVGRATRHIRPHSGPIPSVRQGDGGQRTREN
jgi:hypothetical protein